MKHTPFRFKQFAVHHDRSTMKVGTDGVLLGAWANPANAKTILDIGTGSGLIALMLAQRTSADVQIDAVELEAHASHEAQENINHSPWADRIKLYHAAIQQYETDVRYDLIISNPPYFENSQKPPEEKRTITRHTDTLPFTELLHAVERLLKEDGTFNVILPYTEGTAFIELAGSHKLFCTRKWSFLTREGKAIERLLLEFAFHQKTMETNEILLYSEGENWSDGYKALTKDFYLKL